MRNHVSFALAALLCVVVGCRTGSQDSTPSGSTAGTTTAGGPTVTRPDTARPVADSTPPAVSGDVSVTLDRASYTAGATVTMTIRNRGRDTLGYNQCSSRVVERQQGSAWVGIAEPDRMCTMELRMLMPNETQNATTDIPATLTAGSYRLVITFSRQSAAGGSVRAFSPTFRVT